MLNDMMIRGLKPSGKPQKFFDEKGLFLCWTPAGADGQQSMHFDTSTAQMGEIGALQQLKALDEVYKKVRPAGAGK